MGCKMVCVSVHDADLVIAYSYLHYIITFIKTYKTEKKKYKKGKPVIQRFLHGEAGRV